MSKKWKKKAQQQESTKHHDQPTCHKHIEWPPFYSVRIEPTAEDAEKYASQQCYQPRQLRLSKWLNWITGGAALVGLFGLLYLQGQLAEMKVANQQTKSANEQTKLALHVTERAYLIVGGTNLDESTGVVSLYIDNIGKLPSGIATIILHEATINQANGKALAEFRNAVEKHWKPMTIQSVIPDIQGKVPMTTATPTAFSKKKSDAGTQAIVVAGYVNYADGFADDPPQQLAFCETSIRHEVMKKTLWVQCDPQRVIPAMEALDGYPNNPEDK